MLRGPYKVRSLEKRFWSKVDKRGPDECWPWKAGLSNGYGSFCLYVGYNTTAHRVAWELVNGPMPKDLDGCHSCDNRDCCNPSHIWPGTPHDNAEDMVKKRRNNSGERCNKSKLTPSEVIEMFHKYRSGSYTQRELATEYVVSQANVGRIVNGQQWRHLNLLAG